MSSTKTSDAKKSGSSDTKKSGTKTSGKKSKTIVTHTETIDVQSDNLGAFIGRQGSNYKKIITEIKKTILGKTTDISPKEWSSIDIILKFEKTEEKCSAVITCRKAYVTLVIKIIEKFVVYHKKEFKDFEKKKNSIQQLIYRIGADHRFIGRMIGVGGANVSELREKLSSIPKMESITFVSIEAQNRRLNGSFRNIGERGASENIIITISFKGKPDFEKTQEIIEEFIKTHTQEDEEVSSDSDSDEEDFWEKMNADKKTSGWGKEESEDEESEDEESEDEDEDEKGPDSESDQEPEPEPEPDVWKENKTKEAKAKAKEKKDKADAKAKTKTKENVKDKAKYDKPMSDYEILGLKPGADISSIKSAYKKLALKHHPDKGGEEEIFKKIGSAFENLTAKKDFDGGW